MKNFSLKALGAFIFAAGIVVAGVAAPANAAATATISTTTFAANTTVSTTLTLSYADTSSPTASTYMTVGLSNLMLPSGCTGTTSTFSTCGISAITINGSSAPAQTTVTKVNSGNFRVDFSGPTTVASMSIEFSANQLTVGSNGGNFNITWQAVSGGSSVAQSAYTVTPPVYTLTFNSNDGTNTTTTQTGNGLITLNANSFTRSGYSFAGWVSSPSSNFVVAQNSGQFTLASTQTLFAKWTANSSGGGSAASANLTLNATTGQLIAGSTVGVSASGLQSTAAYTVTVQSTPQTIGSGNAVSGSVNTNVTLPSGLEAGWHTLTFTSTASNGSAVESKYYFKISASGTLLSTSSNIPAELANTGINAGTGISLLAGGLSLALVGAEMFMIARRKRSN